MLPSAPTLAANRPFGEMPTAMMSPCPRTLAPRRSTNVSAEPVTYGSIAGGTRTMVGSMRAIAGSCGLSLVALSLGDEDGSHATSPRNGTRPAATRITAWTHGRGFGSDFSQGYWQYGSCGTCWQ